jgi:sodium-dependent phosphate transporter
VDVIRLQAGDSLAEAQRLHDMHRKVTTYSNNTEHLYSFIQVLTACTASFAHGANDVANAIGPYAVIFQVWSTSKEAGPTSKVPAWVLVYGGGMIVIGLATCMFMSLTSMLGSIYSPCPYRWLQYHARSR